MEALKSSLLSICMSDSQSINSIAKCKRATWRFQTFSLSFAHHSIVRKSRQHFNKILSCHWSIPDVHYIDVSIRILSYWLIMHKCDYELRFYPQNKCAFYGNLLKFNVPSSAHFEKAEMDFYSFHFNVFITIHSKMYSCNCLQLKNIIISFFSIHLSRTFLLQWEGK